MNLDNASLTIPIGTSCRTCPRMDCDQRAFPPVNRNLGFNEHVRATSPYVVSHATEK
jgi:predicted transcriptional regulator